MSSCEPSAVSRQLAAATGKRSRPVSGYRLIANGSWHSSFTLIELLVVVTLMSLMVGMAVVGLDGITDSSRLRSTATQIGSILGLTQTQARTSGVPRLIAYRQESDRIVVRTPEEREGRWAWDEGVTYATATGVRIKRLLIEGDRDTHDHKSKWGIRVGADGRYRAHAVILEVHSQYLVAVLRGNQPQRCILLQGEPQAASYGLLMLELEPAEDAH